MKYVDIHSHLNLREFDADREEVYGRMQAQEVGTITVGVDLATSKSAIELAESHENMWACIGLHPTDTKTEDFDPGVFSDLIQSKKVVAVGECGLDYFRGANDEEKKRQRGVFEQQIAFAIKHSLPLMLHGRPSKGSMNAYEDMLDMLESNKSSDLRGNAHFFVGTLSIAKRFYDIGFSTSFPGVITFSSEYDEVIRYAPLESIHGETDSPFAAPVPYRGKRNEPTYVQEVVKRLAVLKDKDEPEMREITLRNAKKLFNIG